MLVLAGCLAAVVFLALGGWLGSRGARFYRQAEYDVAIEIASQKQGLLVEADVQIGELRGEIEVERRRVRGFSETVESVLKQRGNWEDLYSRQAIEHGNAQALMMETIGYLQFQLRENKIDVTVPPLLKEVQALYQEEHVFPVLRARADPSSATIPGESQACVQDKPVEPAP